MTTYKVIQDFFPQKEHPDDLFVERGEIVYSVPGAKAEGGYMHVYRLTTQKNGYVPTMHASGV